MTTKILITPFLFVLATPILLVIIYFFFGFWPCIKRKPLDSSQKDDISKFGIIHYTSERGAKSIESEGLIKKSSFLKSYSNHYCPCAFFGFASITDNSFKAFNVRSKKQHSKIVISNLSQCQIDGLGVRTFDNSLMYNGNFHFAASNRVEIVRVGDEDGSCKSIRKQKPRYLSYTIFLILTTIFVMLPLFLLVIIYVKDCLL